jgi:hypothetical protein
MYLRSNFLTWQCGFVPLYEISCPPYDRKVTDKGKSCRIFRNRPPCHPSRQQVQDPSNGLRSWCMNECCFFVFRRKDSRASTSGRIFGVANQAFVGKGIFTRDMNLVPYVRIWCRTSEFGVAHTYILDKGLFTSLFTRDMNLVPYVRIWCRTTSCGNAVLQLRTTYP